MTKLRTDPNIDDPDGFYEELLSLHEGRSKDESDAINARLVLILANHIGDREVLREAFGLAGSPTGGGGGARRESGGTPSESRTEPTGDVAGNGPRREIAGASSTTRTELTDGDGESGKRRVS